MKIKACKAVVLCVAVLAATTSLGDRFFEAKSEFTIDVCRPQGGSDTGGNSAYCEEIFNTYHSGWRSDDVVMKIVRQYRADYPNSTVTDKEIVETLAGSELKLVPRSRLVTIAVRSKSPELAAALANAYAEAIESFADEENKRRCDRFVARIHQQVERQKRADDDLAVRMLKFRMENRTDNLRAEQEILEQSLRKATEDVLEFEKRVTAATEWVKVLQAAQKNPESFGDLPTEMPRSAEIAAAYTKLQAVKMKLASLKTHFTSEHPTVVAKEGELKDLSADFTDVVSRALTTAQGDLTANQNQLKEFKRKCEDLKRKIVELGQKAIQADASLKQLEQEKKISSEIYQDLLRKENEVRLAAELNNVIIRVGRPAQIPSRPTGRSYE